MSQPHIGQPPASQHVPPIFNPREVPAIDEGAHIEPAVPHACLSAEAIRQRFKHQLAWTPDVVIEPQWQPVNSLRAAAVLVGLVQREQLYVVLTHRSANMPSHAGQVAFAGGKIDASDDSPEAAALREAHEEIGLHPHQVEVLGRLSEYTTGTGFHIVPVVALIQPSQPYTPAPGEVAQVFEVPLTFIANPSNHRRHMMLRDGVQRHWWSMPYADSAGQEHFIWGATAGMLRNLYRFLSART